MVLSVAPLSVYSANAIIMVFYVTLQSHVTVDKELRSKLINVTLGYVSRYTITTFS